MTLLLLQFRPETNLMQVLILGCNQLTTNLATPYYDYVHRALALLLNGLANILKQTERVSDNYQPQARI